MYEHYIVRLHFTTYDIQRDTDILHPQLGEPRHGNNIMVLARDEPLGNAPGGQRSRFWYAKVLGAFHVNVVYEGPGQHDWNLRRLDFLWVRWYETNNLDTYGWKFSTLQSLSFPSVEGAHSFGFLDPADVIRACHIIPTFSSGRRFADGIGSSALAVNKDDWKRYYVGR